MPPPSSPCVPQISTSLRFGKSAPLHRPTETSLVLLRHKATPCGSSSAVRPVAFVIPHDIDDPAAFQQAKRLRCLGTQGKPGPSSKANIISSRPLGSDDLSGPFMIDDDKGSRCRPRRSRLPHLSRGNSLVIVWYRLVLSLTNTRKQVIYSYGSVCESFHSNNSIGHH